MNKLRALDLKPGSWVATRCHPFFASPQIARVKDVDHCSLGPTLDLVIFAPDGTRIGRESPAMGGPRSFEPCCSPDGWYEIEAPKFPLSSHQWGFELRYKDIPT